MTIACPVCGAGLVEAFRAMVLQRHEGIYDLCPACGFLAARAPHWLDEAYASAIAVTDTGLLQRNRSIARQLAAVAGMIGDDRYSAWLDFAGGYGVLTRMMRDAGLDFWWADKFSANLLAPGFEYSAAVGPCRAVTAFEVMEHVTDPCAFVSEALATAQTDTLVFSTQLYAGPPPALDWWYYAFETGQHIAFYRRDTLATLARRLGLDFHTGRGLHFLSRRPLRTRRIDLAIGRLNPLFAWAAGRARQSMTEGDHDLMVARLRRR